MQASEKSVAKVTHRILAMRFASEFILIYPLYTIMFGERGGVSAAGIGIILATVFVLSVIFEIPTGVIADKVPRKFVLLAAIISKIVFLSLWLLVPSFVGYLLAAVFFALSTALESGATQAYIYGTLGRESKYQFARFWARVSAMIMFSYTAAYVLATIIGVKYPILILASIAACLVALGIGATLPTDKIEIANMEVKPKIFRSALAHIAGSPELIKLLLSAVIVVALAQVVIEYISLYYHQVGVVTRFVPILMAIGNVAGALLFWTLHSWEKFLDKQKLILTILFTALFVASFRGGLLIACVGVMVFTRYIRVLQVQFESNIQHLANDQARATISSIGNFAATLIAAAIVVLVGATATHNLILVPLRIALVVGLVTFMLPHIFLRYNREKVS